MADTLGDPNGDCLDDNAVSAYVARALSPADQQRIVAHLAECETCLTIACAVARGSDQQASAGTTPRSDLPFTRR